MNLEQTMQYIEESDENTLFMLWTTSDPVTVRLMIFMYAENSMKYRKWEHISIIIWGAAARLAAENEEIREKIRYLQDMGIHFTACITCVEELGVKEQLKELDIDLVKWLDPMTALLKTGRRLITI